MRLRSLFSESFHLCNRGNFFAFTVRPVGLYFKCNLHDLLRKAKESDNTSLGEDVNARVGQLSSDEPSFGVYFGQNTGSIFGLVFRPPIACHWYKFKTFEFSLYLLISTLFDSKMNSDRLNIDKLIVTRLRKRLWVGLNTPLDSDHLLV